MGSLLTVSVLPKLGSLPFLRKLPQHPQPFIFNIQLSGIRHLLHFPFYSCTSHYLFEGLLVICAVFNVIRQLAHSSFFQLFLLALLLQISIWSFWCDLSAALVLWFLASSCLVRVFGSEWPANSGRFLLLSCCVAALRSGALTIIWSVILHLGSSVLDNFFKFCCLLLRGGEYAASWPRSRCNGGFYC
jgi:hypothetical protein